MYDIRQFRPTLYVLLILGLTGFSLAAEQPGMWVLSVGALLVNAWLVHSKRFTPLPRWLSNGITLIAGGFVIVQVLTATNTPILLIGQGLVLLHIIKLFEQRANRDYAQLIVLSLLLMVAAAISTASLAFGALFIGYLFLSLYCCLLFHLKVEADRAKAAQPVPPEKFNATTLRQDQRYLPRSMRRLTVLIATVSLASAVMVFLFFPRGTGAGMLGQMQLRPPEQLTGFNDEVKYNDIASIAQNNTPVATVSLWHDGLQVTSGSIRLRGVTFDRYHKGASGEWEWIRNTAQNNANFPSTVRDVQAGRTWTPAPATPRAPGTGLWRQVIRLDPIGTKALFTIAGLQSFSAMHEVRVAYFTEDETLQRQDNVNSPLDYEVNSTGLLEASSPATPPPSQTEEISPELAAFAKEAGGQSVIQRAEPGIPASEDEDVARKIENHLLTHFAYTLDLTDSAELFPGKDPLAVFVSQTKRGHCEFFAGAMTVACQSLGMRARMVAGFVTDEYNSLGGFFQVREAHAHTWVEVLTTEHGWVTFDPTSGRELPPNESRSTWQHIKHVFDWMESKWAGSVIAYDGDRRDNIIQQLDASLLRGTYRGSEKLIEIRQQLNHLSHWWDNLSILKRAGLLSLWAEILTGLIVTMVLSLVSAIAWYFVDQHRIKRRAMRIGLGSLPQSEQLRIARQLGFYEDMTELLARRRITRPAHLTPREFSRSLTFLPTEAYDLVDRLTRIFYRVRYGGIDVPSGQQRRLAQAIQKLSKSLGEGRPA